MNKNFKKIIVSMLVISMVIGNFSIFAKENTNIKKTDTEKKIDTTSTVSTDDGDFEKDETVYVLAEADGSVNKIIVTNWLKNKNKEKTLKDFSTLSDIENIKGDESYTLDKDNLKIWNADGNDIYYKGNSDKEIPVDIAVSYTLDGNAVTAEELAGKSGKVTIRFDYDNKDYEERTINGIKQKIYLPYIMITGTILDNDIFQNIEITNGKIINDGNRTYVMGFSLPGMNKTLGISKSDLDIPDYIEITADCKDFKMTNTVSIASSELFGKINLDESDEAYDKISDSVATLDNAMTKLYDGSSQLYNGVSTLLEKSNQLIKGINKLYNGAQKLKNGTAKLKIGSQKLSDGAEELYAGLNKLTGNNRKLIEGAEKVFKTLLETADSQLALNNLNLPKLTIDNYANVLNGAIENLTDEKIKLQVKQAIEQTVEQNRPYIEAQVTAEYRKSVTEKVVVNNFGFNSYSDYLDWISSANYDENIKNSIDSAVDTVMNSDEAKQAVKLLTDKAIKEEVEKNFNSQNGQSIYNDALERAKSGKQSLKTLKAQLDEYNRFYQGIIDYTEGVSEAKNGSQTLKNSLYSLKNSSEKLDKGTLKVFKGITEMKNGSQKLVSGVEQLQNGQMQLSNGIKKLNDEGIKKISDILGKDIKDIYNRFKASVEIAKNHNSFSGIPDGINGNVRFIYKTAEIEK